MNKFYSLQLTLVFQKYVEGILDSTVSYTLRPRKNHESVKMTIVARKGKIKPFSILISVYVDMGTGTSDTTQLKFDFTDSTALANARFYEIKVTQLPCSSEYK